MIKKKNLSTPTGDKKTYYQDVLTHFEYRRVVGGIAWPSGESPGFIAVVGEDYHKDPTIKLRHLRLLDEYEHRDVVNLIQRLYGYQNIFQVNPWYGDPDNDMMMRFVSMFNKSLGKKKRGIFIAPAPFVDDRHSMRFYAHEIHKFMRKSQKALHFGGNSEIPGRLKALRAEEVQSSDVKDFPAIAALGYAVAALDEPYLEQSDVRSLNDELMNIYRVEGL